MPKIVPELSALCVKRLQHPGRGRNVLFAVGGVSGLLLQITPAGSRSWILRTTIGGKRRDLGLGGYPDVTLAQARERARESKDKIWRGIDPIEERKAQRAALVVAHKRGLTFADAFEKYTVAKLAELATDADRTRWKSSIERHALPHVGDMLVNDMTVQDMLRVLHPIWIEKTDTASRVRSRIEAILSWAKVAGHRTGDNPARWKGNLDALLPKPGKVADKANHPTVSLNEVAGWFSTLREREGIAARALELLTLCAARSGEVRGATWDEFDLDAGLWTIPAARMKAEREHRVPLVPAAVEIVKAMPRMVGSPYVFAAPRGGQLSDMTISAVMRRMQATAEAQAEKVGGPVEKAGWRDPRSGRPAVPHGLRSTFRDWAAERTEYPRDMAEIALAHAVGSEVERAYRRGDMLERRRAMMRDWALFLGVKN
ncbi:tyrosine-type recombinase/integrase [Haematobacter genomosp. 1]|uniref:Integrase n=1 Tax=Haematobacter genomosp. 1 TaxID=366618 RepID=A0A212A6E0_9RHOB|nr:integrase arm-type DNA-binding domain-containing protein [Haematobacter genomosp. 1]OWJ74620.1 integrase [Haematobacter genomosp. 1]